VHLYVCTEASKKEDVRRNEFLQGIGRFFKAFREARGGRKCCSQMRNEFFMQQIHSSGY